MTCFPKKLFCLKQGKASANGVRKRILFLFELTSVADNLALIEIFNFF